MSRCRPGYRSEVIALFAAITQLHGCGADNEKVIICAASEFPSAPV
ncbi:phenolic acid decarboxylase [Yokenella regensburgei]